MTDLHLTRRQWLAAAGLVAGGHGSSVCADEPPAVPTTLDSLEKAVKNAPLTLKFTGKSKVDAERWQQEFAAQLRQLLGPHLPPKTWKTTIRQRVEFDDHIREELLLSAEDIPILPMYFLLPRTQNEKPVPGVVALHGHGNYGHHPVAGRDDLPGVDKAIQNANYDYGRQLARRGYAVAVPCMLPFGDRLGNKAAFGSQDPCADTFIRMQLLGKLLIAENLRDALWAVEWLARQPKVDVKRLACVGLSYGGRMTTLTAALEPRIRVAVISGALNVMQERAAKPYSCGAQIIPGLLKFGDIPEIAALIAPRHCLWEVGSKDTLIKPVEAQDALERQGKVYQALGAREHLQVDRFDGGHRWHGEVAYPLLDKVLK